jgi:zinc protease
LKNLYPKGHPYSWDVIGEMEDLTNASVEDVIAFHKKFYSPTNATLSVSGDFSMEEVKAWIEKYFGEIPAGENLEKRGPMSASLASTVKFYHEDNFAKAPQLTMVFQTAERYSKDSYALNFLGDLIANTKKAPLYTVLVRDKKLTSRVYASNRSQELAGSFTISVTANPGVNLTEVEKAIFEGLSKFENDGSTEEDLIRIKTGYETRFYNSFASVQGKAFQFASYNINTDDPGFYKKDLAAIQAVTMEDIKSVYEKYIKGKNFIETSFVPRGDEGLVAEGSVNAGIVEEDVTKAAEVKTDDTPEEPIVRTTAKFDRSVMPPMGSDPTVIIPSFWTSSLADGIKIWGLEQHELPLVQYSIVMDGGHVTDSIDKAGVANLFASMMNEGTRNKTPEELEDAIGLLGASIDFSSGDENISITVSTLARNFEKTIALVEEMLLEPRWDEERFAIAKTRIINNLKRSKASPDYLASTTLDRLIYGENNILAVDGSGTEESVSSLKMADLKNYYEKYVSPSDARLLVVGDINKKRVEKGFSSLSEKWLPKEVTLPEVKHPVSPEKSAIYFVDIPDAKQSVISIGCPALARTNPDYYPLFVANYKLGGSFNGIFNLILREEKGFTYGARSRNSGGRYSGTFAASSRVRTNSTLESVTIFKTEMEKYRENMPQKYIDFTKDALLKNNALRFETLSSLLSMLTTMTSYNLPADYIKQEEAYVQELTLDKQLEIAKKYIDPSKMYYVVVGDAKTQLKELEKVGLGKPVLVK